MKLVLQGLGLLVLGVVVFFAVAIGFKEAGKTPEDRLADQRFSDGRAVLENGLKDFSSADVSAERLGRHAESGRGVYCGIVNAKNSFGAYTGRQRFVVHGGMTLYLEETAERDRFENLWLACSQ